MCRTVTFVRGTISINRVKRIKIVSISELHIYSNMTTISKFTIEIKGRKEAPPEESPLFSLDPY
jgi:D-arabinose 5-phosphate isomerase GutQ